MTPAELHRLARLGAESRVAELQREIASLHQVFPDLRQRRSTAAPNPHTAGVRSAVAGVRKALEGGVTRRRPKMSAQARKRIGDAQRKRWAEWKAKQAGAGQGDGARKPRTTRGSGKKK
jgi:hypothetical protein